MKIKHLLQMTSGIIYSTHENQPFGKPPVFYYTDELRRDFGTADTSSLRCESTHRRRSTP